VRVLSGGEKGRMLYGKLMLQRANVLVMDEPTNHMDMESIESLQLALELYTGTLVLVSHDRQFVSALATEVLELGGAATVHFQGGYEDYLAARGLA
jgi:ATPase subunit of ABC transporter with duplicated ATPase domains